MKRNLYFLIIFFLILITITTSSSYIRNSAKISSSSTTLRSTIITSSAPQYNCILNGNESAFDQLEDFRITPDIALNEFLIKDKTKRYSIVLDHPAPIIINSTTNCQSSTQPSLTWNIFYNKTINFGNFLKTNQNSIISFKCLPMGRYDFFITPMSATCRWNITIELKQFDDNWPFLNLTNPTKIRLQNRPQRRQVLVKWEKSKLDIHAIHYCMSINKIKHQSSLCEATMNAATISQLKKSTATTETCENFYQIENLSKSFKLEKIKKIEPNGVSIYCTGFKAQQILRGLQQSIPYFIDIFAVHTKLNNFSYLLGSTKTWFNRTHSIQLSEEKTSAGKLSDLGGVSVFSFKIPKKSITNSAHVHISLVPCGGSIDLRIMKKKQKILFKKNLYKPTIMTISDAIPGNRYIIRVLPSTEDDIPKVNKVEVTFTTKERFNLLPVLPKNTTVVEFISARTCRSTTIAWYSSPDLRKIKYCIYVLRLSLKNREFESMNPTNFCEIDTKLTDHQDFQQMYCFYPEKRFEMETLRIVGLMPGRQYYVHLTASLPHGKNLPYESIRIKTHSKCRKNNQSTSSSIQQLNNGTKMIRPDKKIFTRYNG